MAEITQDVMAYLGKISDAYGTFKADCFSQDMFCTFTEGDDIKSPIEQLFFIAARFVAETNFTAFNPDSEWDALTKQDIPGVGIHCWPQVKIGNYRVDFAIRLERLFVGSRAKDARKVIVELDGHAFHDKDKHQRAYEKARDRFLTTQDYRVLHFTGSEVVADPLRVAHDSLQATGWITDPYNKAQYENYMDG